RRSRPCSSGRSSASSPGGRATGRGSRGRSGWRSISWSGRSCSCPLRGASSRRPRSPRSAREPEPVLAGVVRGGEGTVGGRMGAVATRRPRASRVRIGSAIRSAEESDMRRTIVIGGLIAAFLLAQLEDLATAGHLPDRLGSVAERGPLVAPAYDVFGLTGLIALKIGLFALIVGT